MGPGRGAARGAARRDLGTPAPPADDGAAATAAGGERTGARGGLLALTGAMVFASASGYLVTLLAARTLGSVRYEVFAVFWGLFFAVTGVLGGLAQEITRATRSRADRDPADRDPAARPASAAHPMPVALRLGLVLAVAFAVTSPLWASHLLTQEAGLGTWLLVASVLSLAPQAAVMGLLSGAGRWGAYAALLAVDAAARLVVGLLATAAGGGVAAFLWTTVAGSASWALVLLVSRSARSAARLLADVPTRPFLRNTAQAMAAAAAAAALIVGFPVLLSASTGPDERPVLGPVILAVTLTRAPFLVPLTSFQSAITAYFVERRTGALAALRRPSLLLLVAALVAALAAAAVGPPLIGFFFGAEFRLPGPALGALTFGAACTAWLMVTGCAALARARHGLYSGGWLLAGAISLVLLVVLPAELSTRTAVALVVGPLLGSALHLRALRAPAPAGAPL